MGDGLGVAEAKRRFSELLDQWLLGSVCRPMRPAAALPLALVGLLVAAAPAPAPPVPPPAPVAGLAADGTAAVAFTGPEGLRLAGGDTRGFRPSVPVAGSEDALYGWLWVVAEPGGTARVLWVEPRSDYLLLDPPPGIVLMSTGPNGSEQVSPILDSTEGRFDVSSNPQGDVVVAWSQGSVTGAATASPQTGFAEVPGPIPVAPVIAVAPGGGALIVGRTCQSGCSLAVRERSPGGGAFGEPATVPATATVDRVDAALASDGAALIAGVRGGEVVAFERPEGAWSAPIALGDAEPDFDPEVGVGRGGAGVAAFTTALSGYLLRELPGNGTAGALTAVRGNSYGTDLAVRDDGAAAALTPRGLLVRGPGEAFALPPEASDGQALAFADAGPLTAVGSFSGYSATYAGKTVKLGNYPFNYSGPPISAPARVVVPSGPLRAVDRRVSVPLVCPGDMTACRGLVVSGAKQRFSLTGGAGRYVELPHAPGVRRARFVVREGDRERVIVRRVVRGPDRRACRFAPWARPLASAGRVRVAVERGGGLKVEVVACGPGLARQVVSRSLPSQAAVSGRIAAFVYPLSVHGPLVDVVDLYEPAIRTHRELFSKADGRVLAVRVTQNGAVALADQVDSRVRIRAIDGEDDRLLDAGPGVDPESVRVKGDTVTWSRDGAPQTMRLTAGR